MSKSVESVETIEVDGKQYTVKSEMIDTDFGPERLVTVYDANDEYVWGLRESMGYKAMLREFRDYIAQYPQK